MNIFKSIEFTIENSYDNFFSWNLPRGVGVTSYLMMRAERDFREGIKSILIVKSKKQAKILKKLTPYDLLIVPVNKIDNIRGKMFDRIYCDNIIYNPNNDFYDIVAPILNSNIGSYCLILNTTEGEIENTI